MDLKLENVVIVDNVAKIIDIGCACWIQVAHKNLPVGGTLHYVSPEFVKDPNKTASTTFDAWALGVLTYTAVILVSFKGCDKDSFPEERDFLLRDCIANSNPRQLPDYVHVPFDIKKLSSGCWRRTPKSG